MPSKYLIILLCFVLSIKYAESQTCEGGENAPITINCSSCKSAYICSSSTDPVSTFDCDDGEACSDNDGETNGACVIAENLNFGKCGCFLDNSNEIQVGSYVDPYDDTLAKYVTCDADGVATYLECEDGYFDGSLQGCVELPDCQKGYTGSLPIEADCTKYLQCSITNDPRIRSCGEDEIFDFNSQACSSTAVCNDDTDIQVIDPFKCNIFHVCSESPNVHCCPLGQNYNAEAGSCVEASESGCTRKFLNSCLEEEYENMYCKYCLTMNEGDTYSTYLVSECQTKYYECVAEGNELVAKLMECDEGKVYAADTGACEFIEAHPECPTSSD